MKFKKNFLLAVLALALCGLVGSASAASSDNLSGWAWSDMPDGSDQQKFPNVGTAGRGAGWVSFNSTNHSGSINYGVKVSTAGLFSGYAWANPRDTVGGTDNIGWISFNSADLTGCPSGTCEARLDQATGVVTGWARALSAKNDAQNGGWDGWISLSGSAADGAMYGVSVDNNCLWGGKAWGGAVLGWIDFGVAGTNGVKGSGTACKTAPTTGDIRILRVDSSLNNKSGTVAVADSLASKSSNPADFTGLSTGTHIAKATDLTGFVEAVGTCNYKINKSQCQVSSFTLTPICDGTLCSISVSVVPDEVTKVVFKYASAPPATLRVEPHSVDLEVGGVGELEAYYDPDGGSNSNETNVSDLAIWFSANTSIVTVTNASPKGRITGVDSGGPVNVTATYLGVSDFAAVAVVERPDQSLVKCNPVSLETAPNDEITLTASDGTSPYSWSAPGASTGFTSGSGSIFKTKYFSAGLYEITLTDSSNLANKDKCFVRVATDGNRIPVAEASISKDGVNYSQKIVVNKGDTLTVHFAADKDVTGDGLASRDPDGWQNAFGIDRALGTCQWNDDLNQDQNNPGFERTISNPSTPDKCNFSKEFTFNDELGGEASKTFTYHVLKITDAKGAVSNIGWVQVEVKASVTSGFCNINNQCVAGGGGQSCSSGLICTDRGFHCEGLQCRFGGSGVSCSLNSDCGSGGGGGGDGGGGCTDPTVCPGNPSGLTSNAGSSLFCPVTTGFVTLNWNYSDPNGNAQVAYKVQVDNNSDFSSLVYDSGVVSSSLKSHSIPAETLQLNITYHWIVAVKDSTGEWSDWSSTASFTTPSSCPQCSNGLDDDGDGFIDTADPQCTDGSDNDESNGPQCKNGLDDDGDGLTDTMDPQCHTDGNANNPATYDPNDNNESGGGGTQCGDGIDNDNDGFIDLDDPGCSSASDNDERDPSGGEI